MCQMALQCRVNTLNAALRNSGLRHHAFKAVKGAGIDMQLCRQPLEVGRSLAPVQPQRRPG